MLSGCTPPGGPACGVGGGEVPILLRNFRVGGREWMSSIASARGFEYVRGGGARKLTSDGTITLFLFAGSSPAFLDALQQALPDPLSPSPPFVFDSLAFLVVRNLCAFYRIPLLDFVLRQQRRALEGERVQSQAEDRRQLRARREQVRGVVEV